MVGKTTPTIILERFWLARPMRPQLVQKIANARNGFARHFWLEPFQRFIPTRADQRCVNLSRLCSRRRLVGSSQVEQLTSSTPLYPRRPMFNVQCFPNFAVGRLESYLMPIVQLRTL